MSKVFILAADRSEARELARLAGLPPGSESRNWEAFTPYNILGHRRNVLLVTGQHCWRALRPFEETAAIAEALAVSDFKAVWVPCPQDWRRDNWNLPAGWSQPRPVEPKVVLHPPDPKLSWARRLRQMFGGSDGR